MRKSATGLVCKRSMSCDNELSSKNGSLELPPEILVDIFCRCLPTNHIRLSTPPQLLPPFTLAQVCSFWHYLVLSSPQLWNRIVLGRHGADSARELSVFENWLARAGSGSDNAPVKVILDPQMDDALQVLLSEGACAKYERETTALINELCANSHRLQCLDLDVLDADVLVPLFSTMSSSDPECAATMPLLEELKLTTTSLGGHSNARVLHNIARACPRLRGITLTCPSLLPAPVSQQDAPILQDMRVLRLRFCTAVSHALTWTDACPSLNYLDVQLFCRANGSDDNPVISEFDGFDDNLESDELGGDGWVLVNRHVGRSRNNTRPVPSSEIRVLMQLTCLELCSFSTPQSIGALLDSLSTPALRCLKISSSTPETGLRNARWPHVALLLLRSDAPPPLEELEIIGVPMNIDDMRACLTLTPRLKNLSIGMFPELDDLLQELTIPDRFSTSTCSGQDASKPVGSLLCPKLEALDVAEASFSVNVLASMISSRDGSGRRNELPGASNSDVSELKELRVDTKAAKSVAEHPSIAQCILQNLRLTAVDPDVILLNFRVH